VVDSTYYLWEMIFVIAADYCWVDCGSNELAKGPLKLFYISVLNSGTGLHTFTVLYVVFMSDFNVTKTISRRDLVFHLLSVFS